MFALRVEPCHDAYQAVQHWVGEWPFFDRMNRIYRMQGKGYGVFILSILFILSGFFWLKYRDIALDRQAGYTEVQQQSDCYSHRHQVIDELYFMGRTNIKREQSHS